MPKNRIHLSFSRNLNGFRAKETKRKQSLKTYLPVRHQLFPRMIAMETTRFYLHSNNEIFTSYYYNMTYLAFIFGENVQKVTLLYFGVICLNHSISGQFYNKKLHCFIFCYLVTIVTKDGSA